MIVKVTAIADIHFNLQKSERIYLELKKIFFPKIKTFKPNIVFIAGDLFDQKMTLNNISVMYINKFIHELIQLSISLDFTICIIHGTYSHDYDQLKSYSHYLSNKFRMYHKATIENISGLNILFLPEEYGRKDYYKKFKKNTPFDFCIGHGEFAFLDFLKYTNNKNSTIFDPKFFINNTICTIFGHEHKKSFYKNIMYTGSFSRHFHGEEEDKGFFNITYDLSNKKVLKKEFIKNTNAPIYKTIYSNDLPNNSKELITILNKELNNCDFLRIVIDLLSCSHENHKIIMGFFKNNFKVTVKHIKPKITNKPHKQENKKLSDVRSKSLVKVTIEEVNNKHNVRLTPEEINKVIVDV